MFSLLYSDHFKLISWPEKIEKDWLLSVLKGYLFEEVM